MRGSGARALLPALGVLALVGTVAVAAAGRTPSGTDDSRPVPDLVLDTFLSLGMVLLIPAAAIVVYGLMQRKEIAAEIASGRYRRMSMVTTALLLGGYAAFAYYAIVVRERPKPPEEELDPAFLGDAPPQTVSPEAKPYEPEFALVPVLVIVAIVAVALLAAYVSMRRREALASEREETVSEALADVLADTLDDLRAEADPRRAIIAAYARLERVLAAHGLPRRAAETPEEYLARILGDLEVAEGSIRRLTGLFEEAKFSHHSVNAAMKEEAIDALQDVRAELRSPREPEPRAAEPVPVSTT